MESIEITANSNSATTTSMEGIVATIPEKTFIDSTGTETLTKNHNRQENGSNQNVKGHQSNLGDASDNQGKNILAESLVDSATCGRRMFLASLIVASKYLQDNNYSNNAWSKISGLSLKEINSIERRFLQLIVYNLYVSEEERTITEILEILSAGDELLLNDLLDYIQDYLVDTKADWLPNYILEIYRKTLDHQSCEKLREFILATISADPELLFNSKDFLKIEESLLLPILKRDDLDMAEDEDDIVRCHLKQGSKPIYGINTPRGNSTLIGHKEMLQTRDSFLFTFGNRDRIEDAKVSRVSRFNYAITLKDDSYGPCFGDKDLWMYGNFDKPESCSSKEDDYETWITKSRKFGVSEYEVFKIIKK
ncbi:17520_t:CDS:2 [Entrophospora sp. SA101]|nr:17520_t:CDS:2 [Entrophospora sp. SA101]